MYVITALFFWKILPRVINCFQKMVMIEFWQVFSVADSTGAIGGKTGKTAVLSGFCKIEYGDGRDGDPLCYWVLIWLGCAGCASGAPERSSLSVIYFFVHNIMKTQKLPKQSLLIL